uniref:Uncharacterized protein n=1 Tax=Pseudictyota dubia TaxID=2749911 RepID=A0A7R9WJ26_9STRA
MRLSDAVSSITAALSTVLPMTTQKDPGRPFPAARPLSQHRHDVKGEGGQVVLSAQHLYTPCNQTLHQAIESCSPHASRKSAIIIISLGSHELKQYCTKEQLTETCILEH